MTETLKSNIGRKGWPERFMSKTGASQSQVEEFCKRWGIVELCVLGSVSRDDFGPDSDIDFLFQYDPNSTYNIEELLAMESELEKMFERTIAETTFEEN